MGRAFLLFGRRRNLGCRRIDLNARALHLSHQPRQIVGQPVQTVPEHPKFIAASHVQPFREVPLPHLFEGCHQAV